MANNTAVIRTSEADESRSIRGLYGGTGPVSVAQYFREEGVAHPVLLATYRIPPGASEGLHTHGKDDASCGELDEFYFILAGNGELTVDASKISVCTGDYVFVPSGIRRGIANTAVDVELHVHIVAIPPRRSGVLEQPGAN